MIARQRVVLLALLVASTATRPAQSQDRPLDSLVLVRLEHSTMRGRVTYHPRSNGRVDAQVALYPDSGASIGKPLAVVSTDSSGRYVMRDIRPGRYRLAIRAIGRLSASAHLLVGSSGVRLPLFVLEEDVMTLDQIAPPERQPVALDLFGQVVMKERGCALTTPLIVSALSASSGIRAQDAQVDAGGGFRFGALFEGVWALTLRDGLSTLASQSFVVPSDRPLLGGQVRFHVRCPVRRT
jgi:hypothetical protein